jgi:hypothetical protein
MDIENEGKFLLNDWCCKDWRRIIDLRLLEGNLEEFRTSRTGRCFSPYTAFETTAPVPARQTVISQRQNRQLRHYLLNYCEPSRVTRTSYQTTKPRTRGKSSDDLHSTGANCTNCLERLEEDPKASHPPSRIFHNGYLQCRFPGSQSYHLRHNAGQLQLCTHKPRL